MLLLMLSDNEVCFLYCLSVFLRIFYGFYMHPKKCTVFIGNYTHNETLRPEGSKYNGCWYSPNGVTPLINHHSIKTMRFAAPGNETIFIYVQSWRSADTTKKVKCKMKSFRLQQSQASDIDPQNVRVRARQHRNASLAEALLRSSNRREPIIIFMSMQKFFEKRS